jgi:hypothetical protein
VERKDPKEVWIDFLVNGDSFAAYLKARELAEDRDFEVGWEPLTGPLKQRLDANSSGGPKRGPE